GWAAAVRYRVDRHRRGKRMQAELAGTPFQQHSRRLHRQRWHRIWPGSRRLPRMGAREPGYADLPFDLGIVRLQLRIPDRPIREPCAGDTAEPAMLLEIDLPESPVIGSEMRAAATDRARIPQRVAAVAVRYRRLRRIATESLRVAYRVVGDPRQEPMA